MAQYIEHEFYCLNCGKLNPAISQRAKNKQKEKFHRKKLYCPYCRETVNHIECRNYDEISLFKEKFAAGEYRDEAITSIQYIKNELGGLLLT